ncbi:Toll/interleukin-1 receptor domain-containing protein [Tanacetum coccineum]
MSSLTKLVASNIINRSLHCFTKNTNVHSNLFTRPVISRSIDSNNNSHLSVLFTRSVIMSRFFSTNGSRDLQAEFDACLVNLFKAVVLLILHIASLMPEVLEDDLKVSVKHNTVVIKGQVYEKLHEYLGFKKYYCWIDPDYIDQFKLSDIKAKMKRKSGELELTIPKLKQEEQKRYGVSMPQLHKKARLPIPNTAYHSASIRRIHHDNYSKIRITNNVLSLSFDYELVGLEKIDDPNITMEEYIRLEKEKLEDMVKHSIGKLPRSGNNPSEPTVYPPNENEVDFKISLDESDDEDYTVIFDENSFSYKIIYVNDLKTDSGNDKPLSPNPTVDYFDDLDYFKDFKNEFPAIVYNDGITSKSDLEIKPLVNTQHIDEFNLNDETSLSKYDKENVLRFNDLFNIIHLDDLKSEKDNDNNIIDIERPLEGNEITHGKMGFLKQVTIKSLKLLKQEVMS